MTDKVILVLDEGTTSTRAMAFSPQGGVLAVAQRELTQFYPQPGFVEHDPQEIWDRTLACARDVTEEIGGAGRIATIGITNQRETVVAWDRTTGVPLCRAIVWQDRRTAEQCRVLKDAGHETAVQAQSGLLLDPYFSASKMRWMLDHVPAVAEASASGRLAFGTVESWLVFKLSGGTHISDASNASRTLLLPLEGASWDEGLCTLFGVPMAALPRVCDNTGALAEAVPEWLGRAIPITGMAGDQQAATVGQSCLVQGDTKATYGTGAFVLANTGTTPPRSRHRLLSTVLYQHAGQRHFALEGSVFVAGSLIQWLRDSLGLITAASETEELARSVADSGGVVIVPALSGLGAPHWLPDARGAISGLSLSTSKAHIVRAALESMAHQTWDLASAFAADGASWTRLRIDGGMAANDWMAQDLANVLDLPVERPDLVETTALGAAMLAAVGAGMFPDLQTAGEAMGGQRRSFLPEMAVQERDSRLTAWGAALARI